MGEEFNEDEYENHDFFFKEEELKSIDKELENRFPLIFSEETTIQLYVKISEELIEQNFIDLYIFFTDKKNTLFKDKYKYVLEKLVSIQVIRSNEFVQDWKNRITSNKTNIENLQKLRFEWEELCFLNLITEDSVGYPLLPHHKLLCVDGAVVLYKQRKEVSSFFNFYLNPRKILTQGSGQKESYVWTGEKVDLLEVLRALKLSKRIKKEGGKDITFKDILKIFSCIKYEINDKQTTEDDLNDEVIKGYRKNKRLFDNKFYLDELSDILKEDKNNKLNKK